MSQLIQRGTTEQTEVKEVSLEDIDLGPIIEKHQYEELLENPIKIEDETVFIALIFGILIIMTIFNVFHKLISFLFTVFSN